LKPAKRRGLVREIRQAYQLNESRACGLVRIARGSNRYQSRRDPQGELRMRLRDLASVMLIHLAYKSHVSMAIERATERREISIGESVLAHLEGLYKRTSGLLDSAEKDKNHFACIGYLREKRCILADLLEVSRTVRPNAGQRLPMQLQEEHVAAINVALGVRGEAAHQARG
jgi:hypothetical protein